MNSKKNKFNIKDEHGAVIIMTAVIISILLGFTALCVDVGLAYHNRTMLQNAADSAALAVVNNIGVSIDNSDPKLTGAISMATKKEAQKYFEQNNIYDFKYDSADTNKTNIEIYPLNSKDEIVGALHNSPNATKMVIFYKVTPTTDDTVGNSYVEIYAKKHTSTIFGNIFNIDSLKMSVTSAAKCDIIQSGNPAALNYQVININKAPDKAFNITGPLEKTAVKSILNVLEKLTNSGLDFLQNKTILIQWLMGGKVTFSCPNCGYSDIEAQFVNHGSDNATTPYKCPQCGQECDEYENSNKVAMNIITSSAVLNGAIHSNGYANIDIDTIRMRHYQNPDATFLTCDLCAYTGSKTDFNYVDNGDGTATFKCPKCGTVHNVPKEEGYKIEDNYVIYKNGTKYCLFPRIEVDSFDSFKINGTSKNDVFLIGNPVNGSDLLPTVRKSGMDDIAKLWDRDSRINKNYCQFTYKTTDPENNKDVLLETGERQQLINYMRGRFEPRTGKFNQINVPEATKVESGSTYAVDFGQALENGNTWAFDPNKGELSIASNANTSILVGCNQTAPWLTSEYKNRIKTIKIGKGFTTIDKEAFENCVNLSNVILPDSLTTINEDAFKNCTSLTTITIPSSVTTIHKKALSKSITEIRGVAGSAAEQFANANSITFTPIDSINNETITLNNKYDIVLNPYDILKETDLGNNRVLPNAYQAFDNEHDFDFDFDGTIDSLKDITDGKFTVKDYINKVGELEKWDISDDESNVEDKARIILDKIVTSCTGDIHSIESLNPNLSQKEYTKAFNKLFDINVVKAINAKANVIDNTINALDSSLNSVNKNYFTPDAKPVDDYYNIIMPKYKSIVENRLSVNPIIGNTKRADELLEQIKNKDPNLVNNIFDEQGCKTWPEKKCTGADKNNVATFDIKPGEKVDGGWPTYDQASYMEIPSGGSVYIKGYYNGKTSGAFGKYRGDLTLLAGTPEQPTVLYIGGNKKYDKNNNALYLHGSLVLGENTVIIVNGNMTIEDHIYMGTNSHIICNGTINCNNNFFGTGSDRGMVDYWSITANEAIKLHTKDGNYCGLSPHCLMLTNEYRCNAVTTNRGLIYDFGIFVTNGLTTESAISTDTTPAYNSNTYIGKTLECNGQANLNGYMVIEEGIKSCTDCKPVGGVTVIKGIMRDSANNIVDDISLANSFDNAANIDNLNLDYNCRFIARGPVIVNVGLGMSEHTQEGTNALLYVDGSKPNAQTNGVALKVAQNVKLHNNAFINIKGNVEVNGKAIQNEGKDTGYNGAPVDWQYSIVTGTDCYISITGRLNTVSSINMKTKTLLKVGSEISVGGSLLIGSQSNDPADLINAQLTGIKANKVTFTNRNEKFHSYNASVYITQGMNPTWMDLDDFASVYVGGDIGSSTQKVEYIKFWDSGSLYVGGSIYSATQVGTTNDAESSCQLFVGGDIVCESGVFADYYTDILVNGNIYITNGGMRVGSKGSIYSKGGITYNSSNFEIQYILYSDGKIINSANAGRIDAGTPEFIRANNRIEKSSLTKPTVNNTGYAGFTDGTDLKINTTIIPKEPANSVNLTPPVNSEGTCTAGTKKNPLIKPYKIGSSGQDLRISKNTILEVYGDLEINGFVENYGQIIVHGNIRMGPNIEDKINNNEGGGTNWAYAYFKNYNLVYCEGNMTMNCASRMGNKSNGLSLQNGSYTDNDARLYVGGRLMTKAAFDNYGKTFIGTDLHTTWGLEGNTKFSGWGTGIENNTNSVLLVGNNIDTHQGYKAGSYDRPSHTIVKNNSFLYAGKDLTTSASLEVGKPRFANGTMDSGEEQYKFLTTNSYSGIQKPETYYQISDKIDGVTKEVDVITNTGLSDHIWKDEVIYKTLDKDGKVITDSNYFGPLTKYHVIKTDKPILNSNCYAPYNIDYGFVYITGKVQTGDSNSKSTASTGYIYDTIVFGKSILFIEAKNLAENENALKTGYIYNYPFGRCYIGGKAEIVHNDSDFKIKYKKTERWRSQDSFTNGDTVELWYFSRTWVNGDLIFNKTEYSTYGGRKFVMHDAAKCYINGSCHPREYSEIGRPINRNTAIDCMDGATDINGNYINTAVLQCDGDFSIINPSFKDSYLTIFPRATLNANGDVFINSVKDLTTDGIKLLHHSNLRAAGKLRAGALNIGSCCNVNVGKNMHSVKTIHIYDRSNVNVGGNGGGDMVSILGNIEIGKHENEVYKYNTWEQNHQLNEGDFTGGDMNTGTGEAESLDNLKTAKIKCPYCGKVGSVNEGNFLITDKPNYKGYHEITCKFCSTKDKPSVFDETFPIFVDDGVTLGASTYVNGTIKSTFSSLHLYPRSQAYANKSIRSYRSIILDNGAGLYVNPKVVDDDGILYDYDKTNNRLLDSNGKPIDNFYVNTDTTSNEFGNIYYLNPANSPVTIVDPTATPAINKTIDAPNTKFYGFDVRLIPNESVPNADSMLDIFFNPTKNPNEQSYGYLTQSDNIYYYDENGTKTYPYHTTQDADGTKVTYHYGINGSGSNRMVVLDNGNDDFVGQEIITTVTVTDADGNQTQQPIAQQIDLKASNGSITSYGPITVDDKATLYATSNITAYGKTYIGNDGIIYSENGNFRSLKLISLGSLIKGNSVCGFEMKHGTLYAGKNIFILSCADIEGGTIYAIGNILFDSVYVNYKFNASNIYTKNDELDMCICSERNNVNFNCIFNVLGGFIYAPYGNLNVNGTYFEHYGAYIGDQININAFYIEFHRLPNVSVIDMKWAKPGDVYLCEPIS